MIRRHYSKDFYYRRLRVLMTSEAEPNDFVMIYTNINLVFITYVGVLTMENERKSTYFRKNFQ